MNLDGFAKERRPAMTGDELVRLFGIPGGGAPTPEAVALFADTLEEIEDDVHAGWAYDCSELAADLDESPARRRLAAALACVSESVLTSSMADWDAMFSLIEAGTDPEIWQR